MKCVCGASVPLTSRYSLCQGCLNAPDPDDPYGGYDGHDYPGEEEHEDICRECGEHEDVCECEDY